jgi:phosphomevalonate kinase
MRARAPGKVVISGAYAVLEGAHAIVSAVSRYAIADTAHAAEQATLEVRAAIGERPAPAFDAAQLFGEHGKLGLGASAAILVASLAAIELEARDFEDDASLRAQVLPWALSAHAKAQGGGSGIDVAASVHGGTLLVRRSPAKTPTGLELRPVRLPPLEIEVWSSNTSASTRDLIARVHELAEHDPSAHAERLRAQCDASEAAAQALLRGDSAQLIAALDAQERALWALGQSIHAPLVTDAVRELAERARLEQAIVLPSGAGGGDVALFIGPAAPSAELYARAEALGHHRLEIELGATGVQAISA